MLQGGEGEGDGLGVDLGRGEGDELDVVEFFHGVAGEAGIGALGDVVDLLPEFLEDVRVVQADQGVVGELDGELLVVVEVLGDDDDQDLLDAGVDGGLDAVVAGEHFDGVVLRGVTQGDAGQALVFFDVVHELAEGFFFEVAGVFFEQAQVRRVDDFQGGGVTEQGFADLV